MPYPDQPARPVVLSDASGLALPGLSRREYFAIEAMKALMAAREAGKDFDDLSKKSVLLADRMLVALQHGKEASE